MPGPNETIGSSRVKAFLVPPEGSGASPLPIALVEDYSARNQYDSENFKTIGSARPPGNVVNFHEGGVRLRAVYQQNDAVLDIIRPRLKEFDCYENFGILTVDPKDNKPIAFAEGCLPSSLSFEVQGGRAPRISYDGICKSVLFGEEIQESRAAA